MKARRMVFPTHYFTFLSEKVEVALIFSQKVTQSRISVFFAVFICFLDGIVRIVVFLALQGWTGHDGSGTQRGERLQNTAQLARNPALRKRLPQGEALKGSSQLLDLPFQFLIRRSTLLFTDPPCSSYC